MRPYWNIETFLRHHWDNSLSLLEQESYMTFAQRFHKYTLDEPGWFFLLLFSKEESVQMTWHNLVRFLYSPSQRSFYLLICRFSLFYSVCFLSASSVSHSSIWSVNHFHLPLVYLIFSVFTCQLSWRPAERLRCFVLSCQSTPMVLGGKLCINTTLRLFCFSPSKNEFRPTAGGFWVRGGYAIPDRATVLVFLLLLSWHSPPFNSIFIVSIHEGQKERGLLWITQKVETRLKCWTKSLQRKFPRLLITGSFFTFRVY